MLHKAQETNAGFVTGNPLECDCRLSWIYVLRNETKDNTLKHALEKVSCVVDTPLERRLGEPDDVHLEAEENVLADDNYDYYDKDEYNDKIKHKTNKTKKLTDIPLEMLPCPKELMEKIEESYGHPVQNEIRLKAFSKVSNITPSLALLLVSLLF